MHGPTFMANPLACAVALASLELLADGRWRGQVAGIERALRAGLEPARELDAVTDVRVLGAIGVIELDHPVDVAAATAAALELGVWLRPFRELIYAMPPYVTGERGPGADRRGDAGGRSAARADRPSRAPTRARPRLGGPHSQRRHGS